MADLDEKCIYKNALKRIVELDGKLQNKIMHAGYYVSGEAGKYFSEAIQIARLAIAEGAMTYAKKQK